MTSGVGAFLFSDTSQFHCHEHHRAHPLDCVAGGVAPSHLPPTAVNFAYLILTAPVLKVRYVWTGDELKHACQDHGKANIRCFKWNEQAMLWTEFEIS